MNGCVSKAWARGPGVKLSKALQAPLLDAAGGATAGEHVVCPEDGEEALLLLSFFSLRSFLSS